MGAESTLKIVKEVREAVAKVDRRIRENTTKRQKQTLDTETQIYLLVGVKMAPRSLPKILEASFEYPLLTDDAAIPVEWMSLYLIMATENKAADSCHNVFTRMETVLDM